MRLDKFLTQTTHLTRSQAKKALAKGEVLLNGVVITTANHKLSAADVVSLQGQNLALTGKRYVLLHKPLGYECSAKSSHHPLVTDLLQAIPNTQRLNSVGRLDVNTSGLLLLTDDGQWLHRVIAPKYAWPKTYVASLAEPLREDAELLLEAGLHLQQEDKPCLPALLRRLNSKEVELTITEGRYHQVRRMFAALGNKVESLHRKSLGALELNSQELPAGQWRYLTPAEVELFS